MAIRKKYPKTCISITGRGHKANRKTYYVEENNSSMQLIRRLRAKKGIAMPRNEWR